MSGEVRVKEEPLWETDGTYGVSEAAAMAGLYADHKVKDELVLGPEVLQHPNVHQYIKEEGDYLNKEQYIRQELKPPKREPDSESTNTLASCIEVKVELGPELWQPNKTASFQVSNKTNGPNNSPPVTNNETTQTPKKKKAKNYCDICKKEFTKWSSLDRHNRRHTNTFYTCELCKKQFTRLDHLEHHMHSHMGLKPYSCSSCAAKFTQMSNLKRHARLHERHLKERKLVHSVAKNHKCEVCKKKFKRSTDLKRHMKVHRSAEIWLKLF